MAKDVQKKVVDFLRRCPDEESPTAKIRIDNYYDYDY